MKKKLAIALLATLLLAGTFTSCRVSPSEAEEEPFNSDVNITTDGIDYNEYIASIGYFVYTESAYLFFNNKQLTFLEPTLSAPISVMCSKLNCAHGSGDCPAYVDSSGVYMWNNKLYYIQRDEKAFTVGLYRMDTNGKNRILVRTLDINTKKGYSYMYNMGGGYLVLNLSERIASEMSNTLYLYSLEDPDTKPIEIFSNREEIEAYEATVETEKKPSDTMVSHIGKSIPGVPEIFLTYPRKDWIFYEVLLDGNCSLYGYEIATGESTLITEDWNCGALSVVDDTLYWYVAGGGICATQLSTGETTKYMGDLPSNDSWYAFCDNLYFYMVPDEETSNKGEAALKIYDYEGKEIAALETELELSYGLSTPNQVFFYDLNSTGYTCLPVCYLEKSAIADGTAAFIYLE